MHTIVSFLHCITLLIMRNSLGYSLPQFIPFQCLFRGGNALLLSGCEGGEHFTE